MDAQDTLILALIKKKYKESTEATNRFRTLANEVYTEMLLEKYKSPTFTKFEGDGNP